MGREFCPHCMGDIPEGGVFCPSCGKNVHWQAADHQLPAGTVLVSPEHHSFLFGAVKGEGGFGITYIGKEMNSGQVVAIKEYFPALCQPRRDLRGCLVPAAGSEAAYQRGKNSFLSEASMLRAVSHLPSIVHVLDFFEHGGTAYMVMNYLDGVTLRRLRQTGRLPEPCVLLRKALPLMADLAQLHRAGVIHRDIAPDNIMLMPDGSLALLDFGCARSMEDGRSMTVVLKPGFAPVEQYQTRGQGPCTDVYALCATLYYCITGQVPPSAPDRLCAVVEGMPDPLAPPSRLGAELDGELERLLMWGLELQPTARPGSVKELADRLEDRLDQLEPPPPPDPGLHAYLENFGGVSPSPVQRLSPAQRLGRWAGSHASLLLAAAAGAGLTLLVLVLILIFI